jgi:hypothetical protein
MKGLVSSQMTTHVHLKGNNEQLVDDSMTFLAQVVGETVVFQL